MFNGAVESSATYNAMYAFEMRRDESFEKS